MPKMVDLKVLVRYGTPKRHILLEVYRDARAAFGKRRAHTARPGRYCDNPHCEDCAWYRGFKKEAARRRFTAVDPAFGDDHTAKVEGVVRPDGTIEILNVIHYPQRTKTGDKEMCVDKVGGDTSQKDKERKLCEQFRALEEKENLEWLKEGAFTTAAEPREVPEQLTMRKLVKTKYEFYPPSGPYFCGRCHYSFPEKKHFCVADPVIPGYKERKPKQFAEALEVFTEILRNVHIKLTAIDACAVGHYDGLGAQLDVMYKDFLERTDKVMALVEAAPDGHAVFAALATIRNGLTDVQAVLAEIKRQTRPLHKKLLGKQ